MIYKLICAGDDCFQKLYKKDNNEIIIAVDGGYDILIKMNIKVDYYFGDYDSLNNNIVISNHILKYNSVKDDSDFDLTIKYLINEIKITKEDIIYIYNATGGRLDHYYAILNTIVRYNDYNIYLLNDRNKIFVINNNYEIKNDEYKYVSFFSVEDDTIITLSGMKYNIDNYNLTVKSNLCLSNEIVGKGLIKTNKKILVIQSK